MFTGIIEEMGEIRSVEDSAAGARLQIATGLTMGVGDSLAVSGVCLTIVERDENSVAVEVVPETLTRTNLGALDVGDSVNLERPMAADGRFGGHIVQGHVDEVGVVSEMLPEGAGRRLRVRIPPALGPYVVEKGSITLEGVSLTVAAVTSSECDVALIAHTLNVTTLGRVGPGDEVNIEVDVIAKYVEQLVGDR